MSDIVDRSSISVLVAGERRLLAKLVARDLLEEGFPLPRRWLTGSNELCSAVETVRGTAPRCVGMVIDSVGDSSRRVAAELRAADRVHGLLPLRTDHACY